MYGSSNALQKASWLLLISVDCTRKHRQVVAVPAKGSLMERKGRGLRSVSMRECAPERIVNTRSHEEGHGPAGFCVSRQAF